MTKDGVRALRATQTPFVPPYTPSPEFPQLFVGSNVIILAYETSLWFVEPQTWSLTHIQVFQSDGTLPTSIPAGGGRWHFADLGHTFVLANDACMVYRTHREGLTGEADKVRLTTSAAPKRVCTHRDNPGSGRMIFAGFEPGFFWPDAWNERLVQWINNTDIGSLGSPRADLDSNMVGWTSIGASDLEFWIDPTYAFQGPLSEVNEAEGVFFNLLERGDLGFMPMAWKGDVVAVKALGDDVIVYGTGGVSRLVPMGPFFGQQTVLDVGAVCVGGDVREHVFMDKTGALWRLRPGAAPERLGYERPQSVSWHIEFDAEHREYYIVGTSNTLVLTDRGASVTNNVMPTLTRYRDGTLLAVVSSTTSGGSVIRTDWLDFGTRALKCLKAITLHGDASVDWSNVTVWVTPDGSGDIIQYPVSAHGVCHVGVVGTSFVLEVDFGSESPDLRDIGVFYHPLETDGLVGSPFEASRYISRMAGD